MIDWKDNGTLYLPVIAQAEQTYGLPADLLARVAYQECSWRADVISGKIRSPAGAVGMFQLEPEFFPGAGAAWQDDCVTAAKYLQALYARFGDWQIAVAAYNWGPTAMERYVSGLVRTLPPETANYVSAVFTDVPISGALVAV